MQEINDLNLSEIKLTFFITVTHSEHFVHPNLPFVLHKGTRYVTDTNKIEKKQKNFLVFLTLDREKVVIKTKNLYHDYSLNAKVYHRKTKKHQKTLTNT